ncbi:DMT family transporter [Pseudanabaena sp. PCC 6802]|uniref:DMT family transporter n=1 Tax=Pseudanabaena sp. PCC 6802 TaxID=118173 RepID=UPI00034A0D4D|nr:DMT family transporter [Pseudanabaena sp. PCC 6802]
MPLHRSSGRWQLGLVLALLTVVLWGVLAVALKIILGVLDAYTLTWFRFLVSFILLGAYLTATRQLPNLKQLKAALGLLAIATLGLASNYILFVSGLNLTTPNNSQVLIQLAGLMFGVGSLVVFRERYTKLQWVGVGVMVTGLSMFFNEQLKILLTAASATYLMGSALLVVAAITWAIYAIAQKQLLQHLSSAAIMLCIYGSSVLLFSPMATPAKILAVAVNPWQMGLLAFCALNTLLAYGAFAESLEHWEASRVSAVLSLTPLVTLCSTSILPLLWHNSPLVDPLTPLGWLGAVFVVTGSLTVSLGGRHKSR